MPTRQRRRIPAGVGVDCSPPRHGLRLRSAIWTLERMATPFWTDRIMSAYHSRHGMAQKRRRFVIPSLVLLPTLDGAIRVDGQTLPSEVCLVAAVAAGVCVCVWHPRTPDAALRRAFFGR
ncbi:hypothetical protein LX36DRAFT_656772 [Colletotrichum falcatum]|nr:hypothetical protein LX36DRAFT_656772 [Colletotrichum falcatum]